MSSKQEFLNASEHNRLSVKSSIFFTASEDAYSSDLTPQEEDGGLVLTI